MRTPCCRECARASGWRRASTTTTSRPRCSRYSRCRRAKGGHSECDGFCVYFVWFSVFYLFLNHWYNYRFLVFVSLLNFWLQKTSIVARTKSFNCLCFSDYTFNGLFFCFQSITKFNGRHVWGPGTYTKFSNRNVHILYRLLCGVSILLC